MHDVIKRFMTYIKECNSGTSKVEKLPKRWGDQAQSFSSSDVFLLYSSQEAFWTLSFGVFMKSFVVVLWSHLIWRRVYSWICVQWSLLVMLRTETWLTICKVSALLTVLYLKPIMQVLLHGRDSMTTGYCTQSLAIPILFCLKA